MRGRALLLGAAVGLASAPAFGQPAAATGSLERFQPSVPGDAFFGVPSPAVGGDMVPRAAAIVDYAYRPLSIQDGTTRYVIVSDQLFLHAAASLALFDRLLVSADMPFALLQTGTGPTVSGVTFAAPNGAEVGDLRLGLRLRLVGDFWDPFQFGIGGYLDVPTAPAGSYAGDGAVRGEPQLLFGGRFEHFVYSASLGTTIHAAARPHTFDARAGAALVLGESLFQIGPELSVSAPFTRDVVAETPETRISVASPAAAELLLGAKVRVLKSFVIGVGAGPGLSQGYGTPVFFGAGSLAYEPLPPRKAAASDADGDGVLDPEDACPKVPGPRSDDPKKNGCPLDTDGDGVLDPEDACPTVPGVKSDDPKKNGCPPDADGDSIIDPQDACPTVPGVKSDDPKKNGCPPDTDEDGIPDDTDACPTVRGSADPDPTKNGCPHVAVTPTEITISRQVQFRFGRSSLDQTVDPVSDDLLTEVRDAIVNHPEIKLIEVQGHADNVGPEEFNRHLSTNRAEAVRGWLVKRGIAPDKLVAKGYGSSVPLAPNVTEEDRQKNRRVQFFIVKKDAP